MDEKKALHVLRECVNIACSKYPGVASDYIAAMRTAEKAIQERKPQGDIIDLIKALRCLGSQFEDACHLDRYNFGRKEGPYMVCNTNNSEGSILCPFYQETYDVCFADGQCMEWLNETADLLERRMQNAESKV